MLHIQTYLRTPGNSLEDLAKDLNLKVRENVQLGVVSINYDQIFSDPNHPIVQECRALILKKGTWEVLSLPFKRFFNLGEQKSGMEKFDWSEFDTWEKHDGSLISFWHCGDYGWQTSTRGVPDAETRVDDTELTFKKLIHDTLSDMGTSFQEVTSHMVPGFCYAHELMTPENQVVTHIHQRELRLLGVRYLATLQEIHIESWKDENPAYPLPLAKRYPGLSLEALKTLVDERDPTEHEGFVLMDRNFNRVKVKSQAYVFASSRRDSLSKSRKTRIELILQEKDDDVLPMLPQILQEKINTLKGDLKSLSLSIDTAYKKFACIEDPKGFALAVNGPQGFKIPSAMFSLRKGYVQSGWDFLKVSRPASILQWLGQDDIEEGIE